MSVLKVSRPGVLVDRLSIGPQTASGGLGRTNVGASDGPVDSAGVALATSVGWTVASSVGTTLGSSVGATVAWLGLAVAALLGATLGADEAAALGALLGCLLGRLLAIGPLLHAASTTATENSASDVRSLTAGVLLLFRRGG